MKMFAEFIIFGVCLTLTNTALVTNLTSKHLNDRPENCTLSYPELPLYYHGKSSYYFVTTFKGSRDSGVIACGNFNMGLVSIEDEEENTFLVNTLESLVGKKTFTFWTSGIGPGDMWYWMTTGKRMTYEDWGPNEPRNGNCTSIETRNPTVWIAYNCVKEFYFVCEGSA